MKTRTAAIILACLALFSLAVSVAAIYASSRIYRTIPDIPGKTVSAPLASEHNDSFPAFPVTGTPDVETGTMAESRIVTDATDATEPVTSSVTSVLTSVLTSAVPAMTETAPDITASAPADVSPHENYGKFYLFLIGDSLRVKDDDGNEYFRRDVNAGKFSPKDRAALGSGMEFPDLASAEEAAWDLLT